MSLFELYFDISSNNNIQVTVLSQELGWRNPVQILRFHNLYIWEMTNIRIRQKKEAEQISTNKIRKERGS